MNYFKVKYIIFVAYFLLLDVPCYGQGCVQTGIENGVEVAFQSTCANRIFLRRPGEPDISRSPEVHLDLSVDPGSICSIVIIVDPLFGCPIGHVGEVFNCFVDSTEDVPCPNIDVTFDKNDNTVTVIFDATAIDTDEPTGFAGNLRLPIGFAAGFENLFLEVFIDVYVGDVSQFRDPIIPDTPTPSPTPTPPFDPPDSGGIVDLCQEEFCEIPMATDVSFVNDSDFSFHKLTFRKFLKSEAFTFDIEVTRAVGDVQKLLDNKLIEKDAILNIFAYDVDSDIPAHIAALGVKPEKDSVLFNGNPIGFLSGSNEKWEKSTFVIPVESINFPSIGTNGQPPTPTKNTIEILVDIDNEGNFIEDFGTDEIWSVAVNHAQLTIQTVSPIILIHGNNSDGDFFKRQEFTKPLETMGWPFDNSISMPTESIFAHSGRLATLIPRRVRQFGVDSIHIVAHSKGGLDTRGYLATYYVPSVFKVLSLTTLSTPHLGTAFADYQIARASEIFIVDLAPELADLGFFDDFAGVDAGTRDLTTKSAGAFHKRNEEALKKFEKETKFQNVGGDADKNMSNDIDIQAEIEAIIIEKPSLGGPFIPAITIVNAAYELARDFRSVELIKDDGLGIIVEVAFGIPGPGGKQNDTGVTLISANAFGTTINNFTGSDGRNHADIADEGVADKVISTLISLEKEKGDLRPVQ